jgi:hypothetical protein
MQAGAVALRAILAASLAGAATACAPPPRRQPPLGPAAQRAAAEKLAKAFAGVCLTEPDADAATRALETQGWPAFNTVWREPASVFYAAPPSPAGLFVIRDKPWSGVAGAQQTTCVGHYSADTDAPMAAAIARRWGPGRSGVGPYAGAQVWTFRMKSGALTPVEASRGMAPAEAALLGPDEAFVHVQVAYVAGNRDVASLIAVARSGR